MATKAQAKAALEALKSGAPAAPQPEAPADGSPVTYTYPDGSQRVGTPPFPATSPIQDHAQQVRDAVGPADLTGTIHTFTAALATEVTMDAEDTGMLTPGGFIELEALTGDPAAMAAINGLAVEVLSIEPTTLALDLSALDVTGLTADFILVEAPATASVDGADARSRRPKGTITADTLSGSQADGKNCK